MIIFKNASVTCILFAILLADQGELQYMLLYWYILSGTLRALPITLWNV